MTAEDKLTVLGLSLPKPPAPVGAYLRARRTGNLLFLAGQIPFVEGKVKYSGKVGGELELKEGYEAAKLCALNALSVMKAELGSLDRIVQLVRVTGFVCSAEGFTDQAKVVNGASELFGDVLGEAGGHARIAIGVASLPLGAAVELEVIAEVE